MALETHRRDACATTALGNLVYFKTHFRCREKSVLAAVHRRAARMRRLPVKRNRMTLHAKRPQHRAQRQIQVEQHRTLLNMQFQIRGGIFQFLPAVLHALEINAHIF